MTAPTVIQIHDVSLKYQDFFALKNISWEYSGQGEIVGLLGAPESGKTSFFNLLSSVCASTQGEIFVLGQNAKKNSAKIKNQIGYCRQGVIFDDELTVRENLACFALYQGVVQTHLPALIDEIIHGLDLDRFQDQKPSRLPFYLQKRLTLGFSLCHQPEILLLDEPFLNLNEKEKSWWLRLLLEIKPRYKAILIAEQNPTNIAGCCDALILLHQGRILESGALADLLEAQLGSEMVELLLDKKEHPYFIHRLKERGFSCASINNKIFVYLRHQQTYKEVVELVPSQNVVLKNPTLADLYKKYLGGLDD